MLTAAEVRPRGDATADQRAELHDLIATRGVAEPWKARFYRDVRAAGGLSKTAAEEALLYLRSLAGRGEQPATAIGAQVDALRALARARLIPGPIRRVWLDRAKDGRMSYVEADRTILEWLRLPPRTFLTAEDLLAAPGSKAPDGFFALASVADGRPRAYRIHTVEATGRRIVEQIVGENPQQRRTMRGIAAHQVLTAVATDPAGAARLYGQFRHRCSACNQKLTRKDQPGYPHGYGWDCWTARQATAQASGVSTTTGCGR